MAGMAKLPKLAGTPEMIFRWRPVRQAVFPKLLALTLVGLGFALLLALRVEVTAPAKSVPRKASVIYLPDNVEGRAVILRAREGGPFPSRFALADWPGRAEIETAAVDAVRFQPPPYVPSLGDLAPESLVKPLDLAGKGISFLPQRVPLPATPPGGAQVKLAPVLHPLSGISQNALPNELPPFTGNPDAAASWRFLVRLNAGGGVEECVSLEKGGEPGAAELGAWLRRVPFRPEPAKLSRWIAVGIGFTHQAVDAIDAR